MCAFVWGGGGGNELSTQGWCGLVATPCLVGVWFRPAAAIGGPHGRPLGAQPDFLLWFFLNEVHAAALGLGGAPAWLVGQRPWVTVHHSCNFKL